MYSMSKLENFTCDTVGDIILSWIRLRSCPHTSHDVLAHNRVTVCSQSPYDHTNILAAAVSLSATCHLSWVLEEARARVRTHWRASVSCLVLGTAGLRGPGPGLTHGPGHNAPPDPLLPPTPAPCPLKVSAKFCGTQKSEKAQNIPF